MSERMNVYGMNLQEAQKILSLSTVALCPTGEGQNTNTREEPSRFKALVHVSEGVGFWACDLVSLQVGRSTWKWGSMCSGARTVPPVTLSPSPFSVRLLKDFLPLHNKSYFDWNSSKRTASKWGFLFDFAFCISAVHPLGWQGPKLPLSSSRALVYIWVYISIQFIAQACSPVRRAGCWKSYTSQDTNQMACDTLT